MNLHKPFSLAALVFVMFFAGNAAAQSTYTPSPENLKARQEFQDAKFGMFIHWGVYSVLGDGEWVLHDRKLKIHVYERLPKFIRSNSLPTKRTSKASNSFSIIRSLIGTIPIITPAAQPLGITAAPTAAIFIPTSTTT